MALMVSGGSLPGAAGGDDDDPQPEGENSLDGLVPLPQPDSYVHGRQQERIEAAAAARRGLPGAARTWSVADVREYLKARECAARACCPRASVFLP